MEHFENTVTIQRPVHEVFAYLAAFENIPNWNHAIESTTKTSHGPVGVGSTYRQTRSVPRRGEESFTVTEYEPVRRLAIEGEIGPFHAKLTYVLEAKGDATRLTNAAELVASSGVGKLVAPLAASRVKGAVAQNLDTLRRILEG